MLLALSGRDFSTSKPFHIHLLIRMSTICIILLWGCFDQSGNALTVNRFYKPIQDYTHLIHNHFSRSMHDWFSCIVI